MESLFLVLSIMGLIAITLMLVFMVLDREKLVSISHLVAIGCFGLLVLLGVINLIILSYGKYGSFI